MVVWSKFAHNASPSSKVRSKQHRERPGFLRRPAADWGKRTDYRSRDYSTVTPVVTPVATILLLSSVHSTSNLANMYFTNLVVHCFLQAYALKIR
ncbi:hypothetical protein HDU87_003149 [Geranomyces variabilis]|uniref:Uncharacterized protein n=1 Tax=Geranomyces variabilis TaxID=109894 RepID=A0AAD5XRP3_9FUNG|nr:hypothetical protein HDU87_003149 [Geranomyces variabilis]